MTPPPFPIKVTITVTGRPGIGKTTILRRIEAAINTLWSEASASICPNRLRTLSTKAPVSSCCWTGFAFKGVVDC